MKMIRTKAVLLFLGLALLSGCATMSVHVWPEDEKNVEAMIITLSHQVGEGMRTGAITNDKSQMFLRQLKVIRKEAKELRSKKVLHAHWNGLHKRLDAIEEEINLTFAQSGKVDEDARSAVRIVRLQHDIDNAIKEGRLTEAEAQTFQSRLDSNREEYLKMTLDDGTSVTLDEKAAYSRKLDSLTSDLNRFR
jgi:ribosomal protein L19E